MTIAELRPTAPPPRPLVAAALNFADGIKSTDLAKALKKHSAWQMDAAGYFSEIGEVHYVVNRAASALTEARLYAAVRDEEGQLVPVAAPESGVAGNVADYANQLVADFVSPVGGQAQLIHQAYVNAEIPGEFFIIAPDDDDPGGGWMVRSVLETKVGDVGKPIEIKGYGTVPYDSVSRVWRPHPMRFEAADSGMRPVLAACELVVLIDRHFRAAMKSRLFAGLLLMPNGLRQGAADPKVADDPNADRFIDSLMDALNEGIAEEGSASAVTPNVVWGANDDIKEARLLEFGQKVDPEVLKLRDASIQRIVQGLEYPPEVVTGTADVSHWGAWFIGDSFIDHIRPKGDFLADAFTTVMLRPGMEAQFGAGYDADIILAFDYSPLARKPNIVETATKAHDRFVISDASLRRDLGYDDDDAPEPDEVAARLERRTQRSPEGGVTTGPPRTESVAAAASPNPVGRALAALDVALIERLHGAAVAAVRRAAERAGNRAKAKVASAYRDAVRDVPAHEVCAALGPTLLAAAGLTDEDLAADAFPGLERDFRRWADQCADDALEQACDPDALSEEEAGSWQQRKQAQIDQSWEWLAAALTALLISRLAEGGEPSDAQVRALVRQAVAVAGGVAEFAAADGAALAVPVTAVTGIGTGHLTLDMLDAAFGTVAGWRWVHDSPAHPFPPHVALDGAEAATVDEFGINFGGWPGDHAGCLCSIEPLIARSE